MAPSGLGAGARREAEPELIARARSDRGAFAALYDLYVGRIYAFCAVHSRTREEAEDLTAQTFERALNAIARYETRGAPMSSWLFRIAANLITDRGRRGAQVQLVGDAPLPQQVSVHPDDNPAAWVETHVAGPFDEEQAAFAGGYFNGGLPASVSFLFSASLRALALAGWTK